MQSGEETGHHSFKVELMSSGLSAGCADVAPLEPFLCLLNDASQQTAGRDVLATTQKSKDETQ